MSTGLPSYMHHRMARVWIAAVVGGLALTLWASVASGPPAAGGASPPPAALKLRDGSSSSSKTQRPPSKVYWGAWIGDQFTGDIPPWDMSAVSRFQQIVGKPLSLIEFSVPFADCSSQPCSFFDFPTAPIQNVRNYGAIPVLSWSSASTPGSVNQPDYQLSDLISGRHDAYIRSFATQARNWGHPFFLRFDWEMNSNWFPWGIRANGNRQGQFRTAWRHVHDIFTAVGATNATWVWCPYVDIDKKYNLRALYPGSRYVDWTCLDGYNWGPRNPANPRPWRSFGAIFDSTYRRIVKQVAPRKPMILAELATSGYGGNKAAWIRNMLATIPKNYPKVRGFVYFNVNDRNAGWEIESSPATSRAFRRGIRRAAYVTNRYGLIGSRPIRPPARP
jgi:hypothetical protein